MEQKQILIHRGLEKVVKRTVIPLALKVEIKKCISVNICNAAEKIVDYPEIIQKLVWRALHYKCEIETRQSMALRWSEHYEKLTKYIEALKQTQKLILKMCKKRNLDGICIEGGF